MMYVWKRLCTLCTQKNTRKMLEKLRKSTKTCDFLFLFLVICIKIKNSNMHNWAIMDVRYCEKCILKSTEEMEYDI